MPNLFLPSFHFGQYGLPETAPQIYIFRKYREIVVTASCDNKIEPVWNWQRRQTKAKTPAASAYTGRFIKFSLRKQSAFCFSFFFGYSFGLLLTKYVYKRPPGWLRHINRPPLSVCSLCAFKYSMEILQINIHPWHVFSFQIIATDTVLLWNKTGVSSFVRDLKDCNNSKSKLRQKILQFVIDQIPNNFQFKCFSAGTSEAELKLYVTKQHFTS